MIPLRATIGLTGMLAVMLFLPGAHAAPVFHSTVVLSTKDAGVKEMPLGDLLADAIRSSSHADIAFVAAYSFQAGSAEIPSGTVTDADLNRTLASPSDTITVIKITGKRLSEAFNHAFMLYPLSYKAFLQISGLIVKVKSNGSGGVQSIQITLNGKPILPSQTYTVAMPLTLANGALGYYMYWDKDDITSSLSTSLSSALDTYMSSHSTITSGDNRIAVQS